MRITNEDIKNFLMSGNIYSGLAKEKRDQYLALYERATKTTSHLTGMPSGGNSDHNLVLANLADASDSTSKWWKFLRERRELIRNFLEEVNISEFHRDILIHRYVYNMKWAPMVYALREYDKPHEGTLRRHHDLALSECVLWVDITGKYRKEILDT